MADPYAANGLTHVATVNAWASRWDGLPERTEIAVAADVDYVGVVAPGICGLPLTADEAVELADALAEAAATARNLERDDAGRDVVADLGRRVDALWGGAR